MLGSVALRRRMTWDCGGGLRTEPLGHLVVRLCGALLVDQASLLEGLSLDAFAVEQDGLAAAAKVPAGKAAREIRRATGKHHLAEDKLRIGPHFAGAASRTSRRRPRGCSCRRDSARPAGRRDGAAAGRAGLNGGLASDIVPRAATFRTAG